MPSRYETVCEWMAEWIRKDLDPSCSRVIHWSEDSGEKWDYGYGGQIIQTHAAPTVTIYYWQAGHGDWDDVASDVVYAGSLTELIERMDRA